MSESDYSHEVAQRFDAVQELITEMINMRRASTAATRARQNDMSMDVDDHQQQDEKLSRRLRERAMASTAILSSLKDLNRDVSQQERQLKNDLAEQKHTVATVNLGYQNILYQRKYLMDEIARCRAMETLYQDVPLVSLEEFKQRAPEHLVHITPLHPTDLHSHNASNPTNINDDHQLMLNQLQFELEERKRFDAEKRRLLTVKAGLAKANKARKAQLNKFEKQLEHYIDSSAPIQELFRDPTTAAPGGEHIEHMVIEDGEDEEGGEGGKKGGRVRRDEDDEDETTRGRA
ncbi:hypothetical protein MVEG_02787 [Podila verticillata NRRL 6337]|nr:hypothetical protein MVEG_02787 [Podila verticillata NRRL 6337]